MFYITFMHAFCLLRTAFCKALFVFSSLCILALLEPWGRDPGGHFVRIYSNRISDIKGGTLIRGGMHRDFWLKML